MVYIHLINLNWRYIPVRVLKPGRRTFLVKNLANGRYMRVPARVMRVRYPVKIKDLPLTPSFYDSK